MRFLRLLSTDVQEKLPLSGLQYFEHQGEMTCVVCLTDHCSNRKVTRRRQGAFATGRIKLGRQIQEVVSAISVHDQPISLPINRIYAKNKPLKMGFIVRKRLIPDYFHAR